MESEIQQKLEERQFQFQLAQLHCSRFASQFYGSITI